MDSDTQDKIEGLASQIVSLLDDGAMMTGFVFAAQGFDSQGEKYIYLSSHKGAQAWETLGLLHYCVAKETAAAAFGETEEE